MNLSYDNIRDISEYLNKSDLLNFLSTCKLHRSFENIYYEKTTIHILTQSMNILDIIFDFELFMELYDKCQHIYLTTDKPINRFPKNLKSLFFGSDEKFNNNHPL